MKRFHATLEESTKAHKALLAWKACTGSADDIMALVKVWKKLATIYELKEEWRPWMGPYPRNGGGRAHFD